MLIYPYHKILAPWFVALFLNNKESSTWFQLLLCFGCKDDSELTLSYSKDPNKKLPH